jgi:AraC family transcriptional regulator of adaptative response / DNA-3-methyladenine glycosylase II
MSTEGRFWLVPGRAEDYIGAMTTTPARHRTSPVPDPNSSDRLDPEVCSRARLARDPRFDGEFFLAVRTTGIYCRPICPARAPAEKNVHYYRSAAQAARDGYRPCLRCRPESAPDSPAWLGTTTTVQRALRLIQQGALNEGTLAQLAARLGIGERYLRKLFERELGVSPQAIALNQRLLFARKLLAETTLPITDVAFAAGFGSVRRFNSALKTQFRQTPGELRRRAAETTGGNAIGLRLHFRPPYDWEGVLQFFSRHAISGVESVADGCYRRNLLLPGGPASICVSRVWGRDALQLTLETGEYSQLMQIVARVRRMFDLDANPAAILSSLEQDPLLAPLIRANPGIRAPGSWSLYESAVRAIVGQQVSTGAARGICARLALAASADPDHPVFPPAAQLATLGDQHFPMPGRRRDTLRTLGRDFSGREDELDLDALAAIRGVGPWTLAMVALRGAGDPDVFPLGDLGLEKAWLAAAGDQPLPQHTNKWRPWRSYAANLLWRSLSP